MPSLFITLQANKPARQTFGVARYLTVQSLGGAAGVDIDLEVAGFSQESIRNVHERDRISVGSTTFEAATFTAPINCTIEVFASMIDLRLNNAEGSGVQATIAGPLPLPVAINGPDPLPVATSRGDTALNPFFVSGAVLGDTPAGTITDHATAAVSDVAALVLAADATRLEAVFYNQGADPIALGMLGITWAKRAIVLEVGESWVESRAAAKAWYAIAAATKTATLGMQERKA